MDDDDQIKPLADDSSDDEEEWSKPVDDELMNTEGDGQSAKKPALSNDHQRTIIHIDLDCFYAQVEMMHDPALKDVPLGIQQKYLVVTCNYPARERGVTKLMGISEAKKKCPELILVNGEDLTRYREMSYKISEFLLKYTPTVERLGMDENYLDVTEMVDQRIRGNMATFDVVGHVYSPQNCELESGRPQTCPCGCHFRLAVGSQIAADIRSALSIELGISCCAGVAHNKLMAKLVGGQHKPNQQTTIFPCHSLLLVSNLDSAHCIPGVGWATKKRLETLGVVSVTDLQRFPLTELELEFGVAVATSIQKLSFGMDDSPVVTYSKPQMLSIEDSFRRCSSKDDVQLRITQLVTNLLPRVLEDGRRPCTLRLTVRRAKENHYFHRESRQCGIPPNIGVRINKGQLDAVKDLLVHMALSLFHKIVDTKQPFHLTLINITFAKLEEKASHGISSFFNTPSMSLSSQPHSEQLHHMTCQSSQPTETKTFYECAEISKASKRKHSSSIESFFIKRSKAEVSPGMCNSSGDSLEPKSSTSFQPESDYSFKSCDTTSNTLTPQAQCKAACKNQAVSVIAGRKNIPVPEGVDAEVFSQLPSEIQQEILDSVRQRTRDGQSYTTVPPSILVSSPQNIDHQRDFQIHQHLYTLKSEKKPLFTPSKTKETQSTSFKDGSDKYIETIDCEINTGMVLDQNQKEVREKFTESDLKSETTMKNCNSESNMALLTKINRASSILAVASSHFQLSASTPLNKRHTPMKISDSHPASTATECRDICTLSAEVRPHSSSFGAGPQASESDYKNSNTHNPSPKSNRELGIENSRSANSLAASSLSVPSIPVPRGVASDVFSALPIEIQREVAETAMQRHSVTCSDHTNTRKEKNNTKSQARKMNSMLNYLKKK